MVLRLERLVLFRFNGFFHDLLLLGVPVVCLLRRHGALIRVRTRQTATVRRFVSDGPICLEALLRLHGLVRSHLCVADGAIFSSLLLALRHRENLPVALRKLDFLRVATCSGCACLVSSLPVARTSAVLRLVYIVLLLLLHVLNCFLELAIADLHLPSRRLARLFFSLRHAALIACELG